MSLSIYGEIISYSDFSRIFNIRHRMIEVYPSDLFIFGFNKPSPGSFMNKPALMKFKGFFKNGPRKVSPGVKRAIEDICKQSRAQFVEFDEKTNTLILKVNFF